MDFWKLSRVGLLESGTEHSHTNFCVAIYFYPWIGIVVAYGKCMSNLRINFQIVFQNAFMPGQCECYSFSTFSPTLDSLRLSDFCYSSKHVEVPHYDLNLYFLMTSDAKHFPYVIGFAFMFRGDVLSILPDTTSL